MLKGWKLFLQKQEKRKHMLTDYRHLPRWLVAIATCCAIVISMAVINPSAYAEEANATAITDSAAATNENKSTDTVTQDSTLSGRRASRASRAASKAPNLPIYDLDGTATHLNQEYANTYRVALIAPAGAYYLDQALDSALQLSKKKLYKDVRFFALDYDSDRSSFSKYASQETSNVRFASSADASNQDYYYFAWDSYQTFHPDSYQANLPFIVLIDKDNNLVGCETGSQSLSSLIEDYFHISDGSVKNSSVTGTYLGPGTTVYAVDTLQQSSIYQAALKKVTQWRQDALNDSRIRVRYYNPETGYEYYVSIADYLKASNISQEQYLSPGWSNSLEKIAIQRSIEAYDVDLAHTRPDGNSCFEATVGEDSSSGEILAWGGSDIASAIDLWASEKDDYVHFLNGESHGQYGHYEELINPEYQYYGFAGSSAAYYGTVFAGEASDSALGDSSPTNLDGTFTFEVNMSDEHMDQGVTWNAPDTMIAGTSKAASVKLKYANGRYELRGTWTSSNPSVISVDDNGTLHAKAPGTATITVNRQSYSFSKQITVTLSTISFSGNGATSGSMKSIQGAIGQSTTIPNVGFSRTGYTFTGWNTSPDGTGTAYRSNGTIQFAAQDITLYAQWKVRSYSVNFDSNGGSAVASQSVRYGFKASQPASPTRTGHTFQGWYTAKDGGARYDFNQTVTGDVTLHAHWTKEPSALKRLAGATRYDTMEQIVETGGWKSGGTVIVASGGNYPDALAASGLAGTLDAPIVLTDAKTLSFQAFMTLTGLAPSKIIVAGGRAAVSDDVMNELEGICSHVERVAGATRVDTSLKLYQQGTGWSHTAILATAGNFADALSISSYAYAAKAPVFLVDSNGLTSKQQTALSNGQFSKIIVVGGVNAVPERVAAKAQSITGAQLTRLSGATRYETSERIARWATGHGLGMDGAVYATGANFPDALAAGPLAGRAGAATLLVEDANSPAIPFSAGYRGKVNRAYVVGGENAVSRSTADAIADSLGLKHAQ